MGQLIAFIIPCLVTAISLLIIFKLPTRHLPKRGNGEQKTGNKNKN